MFLNVPYDPIGDFAPIGKLGSSAFIFVVPPSVKANDMREFIAEARVAGGKWNLATYAAGTTGAVFGEYMSKSEGLGMPMIVYKGDALAIGDVIGGQIQGGFFSVPGVKALVKSGKLKALGALSVARMPSLPHVPTFAEQGLERYSWPGSWIGVLAPAKTPVAVLDRLETASRAVSEDENFRKAWADTDAPVVWRGRVEMAEEMGRERKTWADLVQKLGIQPQ